MTEFSFGPFYEQAKVFFENPATQIIMPVLALLSMLGLAVWTLDSRGKESLTPAANNNNIFLCACIIIMFIFRSLAFHADICNPDEAHILTPALNFIAEPKLWVAADSTTIGPLCLLLVAFAVKLLSVFGTDIDVTFFLARFITFLLLAATLFFLNKILLKNLSLKMSRIILLFFVFFFSFYYHFDIISYNSEFIYLFFLSIIIYLTDSRKNLFIAGFLCGLMPFVKVQTLPIVAPCVVWIIWVILKSDTGKGKKIVSLIKVTAGIFLPLIILLIYCSSYEGGRKAFYLCFVKNASAHVVPVFSMDFLYSQYRIFFFFIGNYWYNTLFVIILLAAVLWYLDKFRVTAERVFSGTVLLFALLALIRPGSSFYHYMIFISLPSLLFLMNCLKNNRFLVKKPLINKWKEPALLIFCFILYAGFFWNVRSQMLLMSEDKPAGYNRWTVFTENGLIEKSSHYKKFADISKYIVENTEKDDYIVVWGWEASINVYTGRKSATAQSDIARLWGSYEGERPYPHENVEKYIADIRLRKPRIIADVISSASFYFYGKKYALENHSEIWSALKDDYQLTSFLPNEEGGYRIYTRKQ